MSDNCLNCPYIKEELLRRASYYDTDLDFYESYESRSCYCEKTGGKLSIAGVCTEGGTDYIEPTIHLDLVSGRDRRYRRIQRKKHINHKKAICHHQTTHPVYINKSGKNRMDFSQDIPMEWYKHDGQYSKGKIHCGCKLCKPYKGYYPSYKNERDDKFAKEDIEQYYRDAV